MEFVKIAKSNLRLELKKKLSEMTASEIDKQSKTITNKVNYVFINIFSTTHLNVILAMYMYVYIGIYTM